MDPQKLHGFCLFLHSSGTLEGAPVKILVGESVGPTVAQTLVTALTTADEDQFGDTRMLAFDTDSSFWVCNNSATGNICNDIKHLHGKLVPSIYIVGTTTGTSSPDLMGPVILWVTDGKDIQHTFTLKEVIYMKGPLANILSTRRLAELYPDTRCQPDVTGTEIHSRFNTHVLT